MPSGGMEIARSSALAVDLYLRVSTDRQAKEGDSLEEQETELKKFCSYRNFRIHNILIERGKSGGNTNRPEYKKLLQDIEAKKIQAVVVKKLDRLSRSLLDFEQIMTQMQAHEVEFISLRENFDTTTAMGKAMLRVALVFAQLEREQTSERLRDVFSYRASQGMYNGGLRPFGYVTINKALVPHPKEKNIVELIVHHFLELKSTTLVAKYLNDNGHRLRSGNLWDKRSIQKMLQNPIYTGKVKWHDQLFQALHPPLISDKQFEDAQVIFKQGQRHIANSKTEALLKQIVTCGDCAHPMTPSHSLNRHRNKYYYYRCTSTNHAEKRKTTCRYKYVAFKVLEDKLISVLLNLADHGFSQLENRLFKHNQDIEETVRSFTSRIRDTEEELSQLKAKKDKFLDSLISSPFLASERKTITDRITELETEEKQCKGFLSKLYFEQSQADSARIEATTFKQNLIHFAMHYPELSTTQLKVEIRALLTEIIYHPDNLELKFRLLPWTVTFPTNPTDNAKPTFKKEAST